MAPADESESIISTLGPLSSLLKPHASNLGVFFKRHQQINSVESISYFHLRSIAKLRSFLSVKDIDAMVHAFIS